MSYGESGISVKVKYFSTSDKIRGLLAAAFVGWFFILISDVYFSVLETHIFNFITGKNSHVMSFSQLLSWTFLYSVIGIPIACVVSILVGLPVWIFLEGKGFKTQVHAMKAGAFTAFIIGFIDLVLRFLNGLRISHDDSSYHGAFKWGFRTLDDGMLTLFGWFFETLDLSLNIIIGVIAGIFAFKVATYFKNKAI